MVASPQLSRWFYEHEARNRRLPSTTICRQTHRNGQLLSPDRADLRPAASPPKRLTAEQRQALIDLLATTGSITKTQRQFTDAGRGTVSKVTLWKLAKLSR
jgi:hypothetical protein